MRSLFVAGLLLTFLHPAVHAQDCAEPPAVESAEDLERLFDLHDYVFVTRVERVVRRGVLAPEDTPENAELFVYQPPLKGAVPAQLAFDSTATCAARFSDGAIYLVFSNDLTSTPYRSEVRLVMADERGPAVAWILEWISGKNRVGEAAADPNGA